MVPGAAAGRRAGPEPKLRGASFRGGPAAAGRCEGEGPWRRDRAGMEAVTEGRWEALPVALSPGVLRALRGLGFTGMTPVQVRGEPPAPGGGKEGELRALWTLCRRSVAALRPPLSCPLARVVSGELWWLLGGEGGAEFGLVDTYFQQRQLNYSCGVSLPVRHHSALHE